MKVLLSIKPEFVQEIFTGKKKYEYRKAIFTRSVDKVVVYSTKPVGMIVGEFTVENILNDTPSTLWDQYFEGRTHGYALKISSPRLYEEPINPFELFKAFAAPQSFKYIDPNESALLFSNY